MAKSEVSPTQRILNVWAVILILWSMYRVTFKTDLPIWIDEFIAKPILFLLPVYWFITKHEKKNFFLGVGFKRKNIGKDLLFGLGIGFLFVLLAIGVRLVKTNNCSVISLSLSSLILILPSFAAAFSEQIVSTGFVFNRLERESKHVLKPIIYSAILFFFLHVPILFGVDKITGSTLIPMITLNAILSVMTSIAFIMRRNIVAPILIQALYLLSLPILL